MWGLRERSSADRLYPVQEGGVGAPLISQRAPRKRRLWEAHTLRAPVPQTRRESSVSTSPSPGRSPPRCSPYAVPETGSRTSTGLWGLIPHPEPPCTGRQPAATPPLAFPLAPRARTQQSPPCQTRGLKRKHRTWSHAVAPSSPRDPDTFPRPSLRARNPQPLTREFWSRCPRAPGAPLGGPT